MSIDLQWELVRKNNAFVVKRSGYTFSTEPANLTNKHSYKYSGFAQNKAVKVSALEKGVAVSHRAAHRPANKVAAAFTKPVVFKNARRAAKALDAELAASFYRPDLVAAAKARVATLLAAQKERKFFPKKIRANKLAKLTK